MRGAPETPLGVTGHLRDLLLSALRAAGAAGAAGEGLHPWLGTKKGAEWDAAKH